MPSKKPGIKLLSIIVILIFCFVSCTTRLKQACFVPFILTDSDCQFFEEAGIDSRTGRVVCDDLKLSYDYGKYSFAGPLTDIEKFRNEFKGNYHVKFFEKIHIDTKLYNMFMDSVSILGVFPVDGNQNKMLFDCPPCNKVASLKFRNRNYYYPFYGAVEPQGAYQLKIDTSDSCYRKIFLSESDSLASGLYMVPLNAGKNGLKLSIVTNTGKADHRLAKLLESVKLKKKE